MLAWVTLERFSTRKIDGRVAPAVTPVWPVGLVSRSEAFHAGPSLDQRAGDAGVIARQKPPGAGLRQDRRKEASSDIAVEQPDAALMLAPAPHNH